MSTKIRMHEGQLFDYLDPANYSTSVHEVAAHLSKIPRFGAATQRFYSVAQHAVYVSQLVQQKHGHFAALYALHHDDHEAFFGDWPTPLKNYVFQRTGIDVAEELTDKLDQMIYEDVLKLGYPIPPHIKAAIKEADWQMYITEGTQLIRNFKGDDKTPSADFQITCYGPEQAETMFLNRHAALVRLRGRRVA